MKNHTAKLLSALALSTLLARPSAASAAEIRKANTWYPLEQGPSWIGGLAPTDTDVAVWDEASGGSMSSVGTNTSWAGIAIRDVPTAPAELQFSVTGSGFLPPNTFTLGAAGIDLSLANVDALIYTLPEGRLELGTNQTWWVGPPARRFTMACTNDGAGSLTKAGGGTLRLDYASNFGAPCDDSHLNDAAQLTLAGGTIELYGGTHTEIVGSAHVAAGATRVMQMGGSARLVLNNLSRSVGGTAEFFPGPVPFVQTSSANDASSGGGILGGWAICGGDWAQVSPGGGNQDIVPFPSWGYSANFMPAENVSLDTSFTLPNTSAVSVNSLRFGFGGSPDVALTVGTSGAYPLTVLGGGILSVAPQAAIVSTSPARTLRGPAGGDLIFHVLGGFLTNKIVIANNAGSGLTKSGGGTLILDPPAHNTFTGPTRINEGTLVTAGPANRRHVSNNLFIDGGVNYGPPPFGPLGVAALLHGPTNDHLNGVNITLSGGMLHMNGQVDSCNTLSLSNRAVLTGYSPTGWLTVTNQGSNAVTATSGTVDAFLNDWGGLKKSGSGTLMFQRDSTVYGHTAIESGTLWVGNANSNWATSTLRLNSLSLGSGSNTTARIILGSSTNGPVSLVVTSLVATAGSRIVGSPDGAGAGGTLVLDYDYDTNFDVGMLGGGINNEGNVNLTKTGSGTLTLNGMGNYASTAISNCLVKLGNAGALPDYYPVTLGNATLDLRGFSEAIGGLNGSGLVTSSGGAMTLTLNTGGIFAGTIADGNGVVSLNIANYAWQYLEGANTFTGDTVVNSSAGLQVAGSTKSGTTTVYGGLSVGDYGVIGNGWGSINLVGGRLNLGYRTAPLPNPIYVTGNSWIWGGGYTGSVAVTLSGPLNVTSGTLTFATAHYDTLPGGQFEPRLTAAFTCNRPLEVINDAHYQLPKSSTTRLGSFNTNGTVQTFNAPISGDGSFRRSALAGLGGLTVFNATNTYTGHTLVDNGTLRVNGALQPAVLTASNFVTVTNLGTLGGYGRIHFPVVIQNGGTLAPGASIGRLTISNALTFAAGSTNFMELNKTAGTNDFITGVSTLTYGGTLIVTNLAGTLAAGDSFKLFSATTYAGAFANILPATPGTGLAWDTSSLLTNGTLKVVAAANPIVNQSQLVEANFVLSGSGGTANGTYFILTSTNAASPLPNWSRLSTNLFDASGNFSFTNALNPAEPQRYFTLQLP